MTAEARVIAHAKVNLELRVLARDTDGFHGIQTVFQRLELGDEVRVRVDVSGRSLDCGGPELPAGGLGPVEANLAWRAATAYADATGWPAGFAIAIDKRIPTGGGLGGGSADAGAVLRALDSLSGRPIGEAGLVRLATPLGSDVPFLATDRARAFAWSRGERLLALPPLPSRPVVLVLPGFGVSTAEAYARLDSSRTRWLPQGQLATIGEMDGWDGVERRAVNDFEGPVVDWHPELGAGLRWLREQGARIAMLAGSGSTLFGVLDEGASIPRERQSPVGRVALTASLSRVVRAERIG